MGALLVPSFQFFLLIFSVSPFFIHFTVVAFNDRTSQVISPPIFNSGPSLLIH